MNQKNRMTANGLLVSFYKFILNMHCINAFNAVHEIRLEYVLIWFYIVSFLYYINKQLKHNAN